MHNKTLDINVDVGEGIGNESDLLPLISSCNVACGGHAGDSTSMKNVVDLAQKYHVKIGAHPSIPDKINFGRVVVEMRKEALFQSIKTQIDSLLRITNKANAKLHHVKPHGALYNLAAIDIEIAQVIIDVMKTLPPHLKLFVPYNSVIADLAIKNEVSVTYEAFADRNYKDDLTLVARTKNNAIIENSQEVFRHVDNIFTYEHVQTVTGNLVKIKAETFCIHGDNPKAVSVLQFLIKEFKTKHISIA